MQKLIPIIGLEIHVELNTKSKMFCSCANNPDKNTPNSNVCEVCLAHPGTLPVPNIEALRGAIKIAKALNCKIAEKSKFDRKHYFYPDLPKGYQISQYDQPVGEHGFVELQFINVKNDRPTAKIGITRVHLEEDTAKLLHVGNLKTGFNSDLKEITPERTLVDFNRAGVPLVEIVSDPNIANAVEAKAYCQELQNIFRYLDVSNADMEKGHMRCEANVSVQEEGKFIIDGSTIKTIGDYKLNHKVELKNINSFRAVEKAIEYEIKRQTENTLKGETQKPETRGWSDEKGESYVQRVKETAADYRYFPEPDIPVFEPLKLCPDVTIPELPGARRTRFFDEYGFSYADADLLTQNKYWSGYTENVMTELQEWIDSLPETKSANSIYKKKELSKLAGGWLTTKLMGAMSERKINIKILKLSAENFAELIALIYAKRVNSTNAQKILTEMLDSNTDIDPTHVMEEKGYGQISDENKLEEIILEVIKNYPIQVEQFKSGKEPIIKFLLGMVMKSSEGSADPVVAEKMLREKLVN
ncbi:MAG: Asp-tRNA(Asn)/Glu-tRNA(Gln) amidotransferase subunit GatB [Candidatus Magasanikbacteria bacterium]|nr:Asp-tRNA(Asn)/Glu-tRNA(Gln) amidotransferase subunit GatB [Candidatus Magasanikbacteria bacterium]